MRLLVVIQARTGSTRLPGKVLLPLAGAPVLQRMIERVRAARSAFELVVATTPEPDDDAIAELCRRVDVYCFRGHPTDLLRRHLRAAEARRADVVVKIPSDCPLIDPAAIDRVLGAFAPGIDYVSNLHPATWPDGHDVEVMTREALEIAHREARRPLDREHTTPFLWDQPERFVCRNVAWETGLDRSMTHRMTLDWPADFDFVRAVYERLWSPRKVFSLDEVLALLRREPAIFALNARYAGVNWYRDHLGELSTVGAAQTRSAP